MGPGLIGCCCCCRELWGGIIFILLFAFFSFCKGWSSVPYAKEISKEALKHLSLAFILENSNTLWPQPWNKYLIWFPVWQDPSQVAYTLKANTGKNRQGVSKASALLSKETMSDPSMLCGKRVGTEILNKNYVFHASLLCTMLACVNISFAVSVI